MKKYFYILFLSILLCLGFIIKVAGQGNYPITVQVQLPPPYSAYVSDYKNKPVISFTNHSQAPLDVYIRGRMENDRGQYIQSAPNTFSNIPIHVPGMQTVVVQGNQLGENYFSLNNVQTNFDDETYSNLFQLGLIPEGFYIFCIYAYVRNANGNYIPVSDPQGPGGCFSYNVGYVTPPHILSPVPDGEILPSPNQNVNISWTRPSGNMQGASLVYDLYIVKVLPGQNPNVSLNNAVQFGAGLFLKQSNIPINNFQFTNLTTFQLDEGSQYALMVQARDLTGKTAFENNGRSEIQVFQYGEKHKPVLNPDPILSILSPSKNKDTLTISADNDLYLNWGWMLNNKLFNPDSVQAFKDKNIHAYRITLLPAKNKKSGREIDNAFNYQVSKKVTPSSKNVAVSYLQKTEDDLKTAGLKDHFWYRFRVEALNSSNQVVSNTQSQDFCILFEKSVTGPAVTVKGQLRYRFDGYKENYPIPKTSVRFYPATEKSPQPDDIFVLTDAKGNFQADIPINKGSSFKMEIKSPYYQQQDTVFDLPDTVSTIQLGQLITKVFNYSLTLNVEKEFGNYVVTKTIYSSGTPQQKTFTIGTPDSLIKEIPEGLNVMLYRKKRPSFLPPEEGDMLNLPETANVIPVSEGRTAITIDKEGKRQAYVKFDRLICNMLPEDVYYIKAIKIDEKNKGGNPEAFQEGPFTAPEQELAFHKPKVADTTHFDVDSTYALISTDPPKSLITGRLVYQWPGDPDKTLRPLANEKFSIVVEYVFNGKLVTPTIRSKKEGVTMSFLTLEGENSSIERNFGSVMATGTTDENGYFSIQAVNLNNKGVLGKGTLSSAFIPEHPKQMQNQQIFINPMTQVADIMTPQKSDGMGQKGKGIINFSDQIGNVFGVSNQVRNLNHIMNPGVMGNIMNAGVSGFGAIQKNNNHQTTIGNIAMTGHGPFYLPKKIFTNQKENKSNQIEDDVPPEPGTIQRVYRIRLNDADLYYNPDKNIVVQALQATDAGQITVKVKEVQWELTAIDQASSQKLSGLKAVVFRNPEYKTPNLPQGEGDERYRMKTLINPQFTSPESDKISDQLKYSKATVTKNMKGAAKPTMKSATTKIKPSPSGKFSGITVSGSPKLASPELNAMVLSQWGQNKQASRNDEEFKNGSFTVPQGRFEWLEDTTTNSAGAVTFTRLLGNFPDYHIEFSSNPQTDNLFYEANFSDAPIIYANNITPENICRYGNYWDQRNGNVEIPVAYKTIKMTPKPSRVGGRVIDKTTGLGIPNADVAISCNNCEFTIDTKMHISEGNTNLKVKTVWLDTDKDGYFEFPQPFKGMPEGVSNISISITANAYGYSGGVQKSYKGLSRSGKQYVDDYLLIPAAQIIGKVTDEQGKPVEAYIKRSDGKIVSTWSPSGMTMWKAKNAPLIDKISSMTITKKTSGEKPSVNAGAKIMQKQPNKFHFDKQVMESLLQGNQVAQPKTNAPKLKLESSDQPVLNKQMAGQLVHHAGQSPALTTDPNTKGGFSINVPNNKPVTFYIIPKDVGYFPDTITLSNVKTGITDVGTKIVFRRRHRMKFVIKDSATNQPVSQAKLYISKTQHTLTDASGSGIFNFENVSVNNYTLKITGPEGEGYVPRLINLRSRETKNQLTYSIKLYKGASVSGIVTLDNKPVAHAKIYLDYKAVSAKEGIPEIAAFSDATGHYELNGIPITKGSADIVATLDTSFTVVGDKKSVSLNSNGTIQNMTLKSYHEMLINSLYGFPLSVEKIEPAKKKGQVKVSGKVDISKGISDFTFITGTHSHVSVSNVLFEAKKIKGQMVGEPLSSQVKMDATSSLKLSYKDKYNVLLTPGGQNAAAPTSLQIYSDKSTGGFIKGYINIVDNSFNYPSSYLNFTRKDQFYFSTINKDQIDNNLNVITSGGNAPNLIYHLSSLDKKPIQFKFIEFNATANPFKSYIDQEGKIHLDVRMSCYIPHAQPSHFEVHAGDIVLDNNKVYPGKNAEPLSVKLEEWTLLIQHWGIDPKKGGIYSNDGLIKTGKIDIPFMEFNLRSDMFVMDSFKVSKIGLGSGVKYLEDIDQKNTLIVYDPRTGSDMSGHWKVAIAGAGNQPAAKIKNLSFNGLQYLNRDINIEYIQLLSNGENIFSLQQTDKPFSINQNDVAQFRPQSISSGPGFFKVTGGMTLPAPRIVPFMATLQFTGSPSALKMEILPVQMSFEGKGYVNFVADQKKSPTIKQDQIIMSGAVESDNKFNPIPSKLFADGKDAVNAFFHVDLKKDFILNLTSKASAKAKAIGKYNLKLLADGGMEIVKGAADWDLLQFSGHLLTNDATLDTKGVNSNFMKFEIPGDVDVNGNAAKVSNIDLPFGKMKMVYLFKEKRLVGNLHVDSIKLGTFRISGEVEMQMEPAGWYFLGSCLIKTGIPGPFSSLNMGFLLGNHSFDNSHWGKISNTVAQYSYDKSSLCWLTNNGARQIKGVFITAGKDLINQKLGLDIGIAKFYLKARAGGEASLYASFDPAWEIQMSAGLYADVAAGASALGVSVDGRVIVKGSMTGAVGSKENCIGGKISASLTAQGHVHIPPAPDIPFGPLEENAVLKILISNISGVSTDFYFGQAPPPTCGGTSACSN